MIQIAIIDHNEHRLFVEDIDEDILNEKYGGDEQKYIDAHYDMENYSWDYIVNTTYIPSNCSSIDDTINVDFESLKDSDW